MDLGSYQREVTDRATTVWRHEKTFIRNDLAFREVPPVHPVCGPGTLIFILQLLRSIQNNHSLQQQGSCDFTFHILGIITPSKYDRCRVEIDARKTKGAQRGACVSPEGRNGLSGDSDNRHTVIDPGPDGFCNTINNIKHPSQTGNAHAG